MSTGPLARLDAKFVQKHNFPTTLFSALGKDIN